MQAPGLKQGLLVLALEFTPLVGPLDPKAVCALHGTQGPGGGVWGWGPINDFGGPGPALALGHQDEMVAPKFVQAFVLEGRGAWPGEKQ